MNLLRGLLIVLCLIAFVSAEGNRTRSSQKFKVFKQRRPNPEKLGGQENYRDELSPISRQAGIPPPPPPPPPTPPPTQPTTTGPTTTTPSSPTPPSPPTSPPPPPSNPSIKDIKKIIKVHL